jgi:HEAT repeat protein
LVVKRDWPGDLLACKTLPEVRALREALRDDAEPALALLMHPRPQARIAALAALEFRPEWKKGQAAAVLQAAKFATEWQVRAAALLALANSDDPQAAALIAVYLRDATPEVRRTAAEALLWNAEQRWTITRHEIRRSLSDPRCLSDGPLPVTASLPKQALSDLTIWAGESGPVSCRAVLTLLEHYRRELRQDPNAVLGELVARSVDATTPASLRVEYARLLADRGFGDSTYWEQLVGTDQPTYLRLMGAKALLKQGSSEAAMQALRDVARVPNREMAIEVAAIVQKLLRVDMGLPLGEELPEPQSKIAAEVARRVIEWASGTLAPKADDRPTRRARLSSIARQITRGTDDRRR